MKQEPLVSIIMPSYNSERFIETAINSVLKQTYKNLELLIVDGMSVDKTRQIIVKYSNLDSRLRLIDNHIDRGPSQARSFGILKSLGKFIAFIDSDDIWLPNKLNIQINFLTINNFKVCVREYKKISESGKISKFSMGMHPVNSYYQYLGRRGISNSSVIVDRECFTPQILNTCGKYHGEDTLWWLLIMKNGIVAYGIPQPLIYYRTVHDSLSSKIAKNQLTVWHSYRNELELGKVEAGCYYILYVIDVLMRRIKFKLKTMIFL